MTDDDDRPTLPGTFDAAELGDDESEPRIMLPPLEPAPRLDDTPVARPPRNRGFRTTEPAFRAEPAARVEELVLEEEEIDTWRPPPPVPEPVATTAGAGALADPSSIAPRELARRQPPPSRRAAPILGAALLLIGAGTLLLRRAERSEPEARTEPPRSALAHEMAAAAPRAAPSAIADSPMLAPAVKGPSQPTNATQPVGIDPSVRDVALSASAQRSTLDPARPRIAGKLPRAPRPAIAPAELPETPSRKDVAGSLDALRTAIQTCSDGRSGVAEVDLTIHSSGAVAHALVSGDFAGTPQGSCMARALRSARFAPFQKPKFRVLYRFML